MWPTVEAPIPATGWLGIMDSGNVPHPASFMLVDSRITGGDLISISLATGFHTSGQQGMDNVIDHSIKVCKQCPFHRGSWRSVQNHSANSCWGIWLELRSDCWDSSALTSLSTRVRLSLWDNSPSSPHLRLDRSEGDIRYRSDGLRS